MERKNLSSPNFKEDAGKNILDEVQKEKERSASEIENRTPDFRFLRFPDSRSRCLPERNWRSGPNLMNYADFTRPDNSMAGGIRPGMENQAHEALKTWQSFPPVPGVQKPQVGFSANAADLRDHFEEGDGTCRLLHQTARETCLNKLVQGKKWRDSTLYGDSEALQSKKEVKENSFAQQADESIDCGSDSAQNTNFEEYSKMNQFLTQRNRSHHLVLNESDGSGTTSEEDKYSHSRDCGNKSPATTPESSGYVGMRNGIRFYDFLTENKTNRPLNIARMPPRCSRSNWKHLLTAATPIYATDVPREKKFRPKSSYIHRKKLFGYLDPIKPATNTSEELKDSTKSDVSNSHENDTPLLGYIAENVQMNEKNLEKNLDGKTCELKLEDFTEEDFISASPPRQAKAKRRKSISARRRIRKVGHEHQVSHFRMGTRPSSLRIWIINPILQCFGRSGSGSNE